MSVTEVRVPQLSESVAEGTLLQWKKKTGEPVKREEILVEVETDKVVLEVPAPSAGILSEIICTDGATVKSDELIARINTDAAAQTTTAARETKVIASADKTTKDQVEQASQVSVKNAMPAAAKLMAEYQLSTQQIQGTGRDGRVTKGDVLAHIQNKNQDVAPMATATKVAIDGEAAAEPFVPDTQNVPVQVQSNLLSDERPQQRVPMSRLRARIAERLLQSQANSAILTTFNEVNMQPIIDLRKKFNDRFEKEHGIKLGFMSLFVKAAIVALKRFPVLNASTDGNEIVYHGYYDIGIAVGSPRGLVVPVVHDADQLRIADIEKSIADFGVKAKEGKLKLEELTGGTFSISNGGVFGSMLSTPIINPPQSAILGIHATKDRPVVENGQIVIRPMNYLAMSYDHRIIDGREAVLGLMAMKEALEDPARILLDI